MRIPSSPLSFALRLRSELRKAGSSFSLSIIHFFFFSMYIVYILKSYKNKTYYVGLTKNLNKRIVQHNDGESKYTRPGIPWELQWYCVFNNKNKAEKFEKYLKSGSGNAFFKKRMV